MGKVKESGWLGDYMDGHELEQSRDNYNWLPLNHEPCVGSGWFYRKKESNVVPIHQSDDPILPDNIA